MAARSVEDILKELGIDSPNDIRGATDDDINLLFEQHNNTSVLEKIRVRSFRDSLKGLSLCNFSNSFRAPFLAKNSFSLCVLSSFFQFSCLISVWIVFSFCRFLLIGSCVLFRCSASSTCWFALVMMRFECFHLSSYLFLKGWCSFKHSFTLAWAVFVCGVLKLLLIILPTVMKILPLRGMNIIPLNLIPPLRLRQSLMVCFFPTNCLSLLLLFHFFLRRKVLWPYAPAHGDIRNERKSSSFSV